MSNASEPPLLARIAREKSICLLSGAILSAGISGAFAQAAPDPIQKLTGKWDVSGTITSILISPDHFVLHSRLGRGDIKWENAAYYTILYRERSITCHYLVRLKSKNDLSMLRYENTDLPECDLGEMQRSAPAEEQAQEQNPVKPETSVGEPTSGLNRGETPPRSGAAHTPPGAHPSSSKYYFVWDTRLGCLGQWLGEPHLDLLLPDA